MEEPLTAPEVGGEADPAMDAPGGPPERAGTLAELLARRRGDGSTGLLADDRRWSWAEVVARSERWAAAIATRVGTGVRGVRHVALLLDNRPEYLFALFGASIAGVTVVGLNTTRRGAELERDLLHTDCSLVLTDAANAHLLDGVDASTVPVVDVDDPAWSAEVDDAGTIPAAGSESEPADALLLIFTSGSTGAPKAVVMSNGRAAAMAEDSGWFGADDVLYCAMPLFHGNALNAIVFPALSTGAAIALRERFSATRFMDDLRLYGATFFSSVGRAIGYVLATPERPDDRDHSVRYALAPEASATDVRGFRRRFGITCISGYGSSENAVVMVPAADMPRDALGVPREGLDVAVIDPDTLQECPRAVIDDDGRLLNAADAIGEIVGRNAAERFEGYYENPEAEAERRRNGWYWTGDLGYRDEEGWFYFAGRQGEWLRVDSENFAAAPVERVLGRFPGVAAVSVFGVPDERTADDQVMAAVEMDPGADFDPAGFGDFLGEQRDLAPKWVPRYVRVGPLPVGPTNKIDRRVLQARGWHSGGTVYWRPERGEPYRLLTPQDAAELRATFAEHGRAVTRLPPP